MTSTLESRVKSNRKGLPLSEEGVRRIINSYNTFHGNATETARKLRYCVLTVVKYWNKNGLIAIGNSESYRGFETPLDCFRAYKRSDKGYRNLTRYGLAQKDSGLHRALIRHGQIEGANLDKEKIAGRPPLSKKEIDGIVKIYIQTGHMGKTVEITGHSYPTISKYLRYKGIEIKENRGRKRRI